MKFTKILERVSNRRTQNKDKIFTAFIREKSIPGKRYTCINARKNLLLIIDPQNTLKDTNSIFSAYDIIIPTNLVFQDLLINNSKTNRKSMLGEKVESQKLDLSTSTGSMFYKIKWIHITSIL